MYERLQATVANINSGQPPAYTMPDSTHTPAGKDAEAVSGGDTYNVTISIDGKSAGGSDKALNDAIAAYCQKLARKPS